MNDGMKRELAVLPTGNEIWKFPLRVTDLNEVQMPEGAQILSVGMQRGTICIWAIVDPQRERKARLIRIFGTGNPMDSVALNFIGTVQQLSNVSPLGDFVWHVFEQVA